MSAPLDTTDHGQWNTQESPAAIWFEQASYIADSIGLAAYGMHIIAFVLCAHALLTRWAFKKSMEWLSFISLLFICGTTNIVLNLKYHERAWIEKRAFPGGPLNYLLSQQDQPMSTVGNAASIMIGFLTDALLIYRVHVVYKMWYLIVIPILSWLGMTALGALFVCQAANPNSSLVTPKMLNFTVPYFAIAMALNIFLTCLLVGRLWYMRTKIGRMLGPGYGKPYQDIAAMIVESAIPYAIVSAIFLALYTAKNASAKIFIPLYLQIQCISPMMIIFRVARGNAWSNDTISNSNLSKIEFSAQNKGVRSEPIVFRSITPNSTTMDIMNISSTNVALSVGNSHDVTNTKETISNSIVV